MPRLKLTILVVALALGGCTAGPPAQPEAADTTGKDHDGAPGLGAYPLAATGLLPAISASGGGRR
jgi:hypothetical protein